MSSILKALKKLDNNSPQQKDGENHFPQIDTKQTIQKRLKGIWIFQRAFSALFVSLIFIGCIWLILKYNPLWVKKLFPDAASTKQHTEAIKIPPVSVSDHRPALIAQKKEIITPEPIVIPEKKTHSPSPGNEMHVLKESREFEAMDFKKPPESPRKEQTEKIVKSVGNVKIEIEKPSPRSQTESGNEDKKPSLSEKRNSPPVLLQKKQNIPIISDAEKKIKDSYDLSIQATTEAVTESELEDKDDSEEQISPENDAVEAIPKTESEESQIPLAKSEAVSVAPEKKKPAPEPETTAVTDDPRFKLQALVWSADPQGCFVVINDKITRIGNSIANGVILDSIGEDYIIIQEGDKKWKQIFQMK